MFALGAWEAVRLIQFEFTLGEHTFLENVPKLKFSLEHEPTCPDCTSLSPPSCHLQGILAPANGVSGTVDTLWSR